MKFSVIRNSIKMNFELIRNLVKIKSLINSKFDENEVFY